LVPLRAVLLAGEQSHYFWGEVAGHLLYFWDVRGARGLGSTTMRTPGIPRAVARAWAALVKVLVITLTDGTPLDSVITVSWRPHAVQDPQSAMAWITTSHSSDSDSMVSSAQGAL